MFIVADTDEQPDGSWPALAHVIPGDIFYYWTYHVDIIMDVVDGFEFLSRLREKKEMEDIPLIFLTAKNGEADRIKGIQLGAVDYIKKDDFSVTVLTEKMKSLRNICTASGVKKVRELREKVLKNLTGTLNETLSNNENEQDDYGTYQEKCKKYNISNREQEVLSYLLKG